MKKGKRWKGGEEKKEEEYKKKGIEGMKGLKE